MSRIVRVNVFAFLALVALIAGNAAIAAPHDVTTGQFLMQIARAQSLEAGNPTTAAESLRATGVDLPAVDPKAPLTEGTVAQIANSLGLRVTTSNPNALFTQAQSDSFISTFGQIIKSPTVSPETMTPGFDPKSKGKKKGLTKSRSNPY